MLIFNECFFNKNDYEKDRFVDIKKITSQEICLYCDKDYHMPQHIFFIDNYRGVNLFGRKTISALSTENKINSTHCSMITCHMILGVLKDYAYENRNIMIEYYPLTKGEKVAIFRDLSKDRLVNIFYPFLYKDFATGNENKITALSGWSFNPKRLINLSHGEEHFRQFTIELIKDYYFEGIVIYDPACSTGEFLYTLKQKYNGCVTIGHDMSSEMVEYAKDFLDYYSCVNAINSPVDDGSVDMLFLRFLNSEITTKEEAKLYFMVLYKKVKAGGHIICFGHTSVLLEVDFIKLLGMDIISCNGYCSDRDALFQYYILKNTGC